MVVAAAGALALSGCGPQNCYGVAEDGRRDWLVVVEFGEPSEGSRCWVLGCAEHSPVDGHFGCRELL